MEEVAVAWGSFSVRRLSAHTGAEIAGVDLNGPVTTKSAKRRTMPLRPFVIVIRDQKLNGPQFLEAMKIFGGLLRQSALRCSNSTMLHPEPG
jgi:hypothetical protein